MSGLLAIIAKDSVEKINFQKLKVMTDSLYHRGPDDEGYALFYNGEIFEIANEVRNTDQTLKEYYNSKFNSGNPIKGSLAFGFRRLSVIDLTSQGHQPMNYLNRYWIVCDGAIYNYKELRLELIQLGYSFKSESDTEVILASYDYWGVECFNKFNGMWAFIIYDTRKNELIISRDRFGIKPLFYFENNDKIILASEIKAIHKASLNSQKVSENLARSFIMSGEILNSSNTLFTNIKRFPAASYFKASLVNFNIEKEKIIKYWTLSINNDEYFFNENEFIKNINTYLTLLKNSVELHSVSDFQVGATLSGGLDSSSIVYFLNKNQSHAIHPIETCSNVYNDIRFKELDESSNINLLSEFLKLKSHKIQPNNDKVFEDFSDMIYYSDLPTQTTNISGWYTYKLINTIGLRVTLDGMVADTLFSGLYSDYAIFLKDLNLRYFIKELNNTKSIYSDLNRYKITQYKLFRSLPKFLQIYLAKSLNMKEDIFLPFNDYLNHHLLGFVQHVLRYIDSMSMAHSIESRLPFLDYRLVEFAFNLNKGYKIHNGWTKYICRSSMNKLLPDEIVWKKEKIGWANADNFWFDELHFDKVTSLLKNSHLLSEVLSSSERENIIKSKLNFQKTLALSLSMWERRCL